LETFLLNWQGAAQVNPGDTLLCLECKLSYGSKGTDDMLRTDRGRILTAMDSELLQMCEQNCAQSAITRRRLRLARNKYLLERSGDGRRECSQRSVAAHGDNQTVFLLEVG